MKKIYILTEEEAGPNYTDSEPTEPIGDLTRQGVANAYEIYVEVPSGLFVFKSKIKKTGIYIERNQMNQAML